MTLIPAIPPPAQASSPLQDLFPMLLSPPWDPVALQAPVSLQELLPMRLSPLLPTFWQALKLLQERFPMLLWPPEPLRVQATILSSPLLQERLPMVLLPPLLPLSAQPILPLQEPLPITLVPW
jgi:hypothetical protein